MAAEVVDDLAGTLGGGVSAAGLSRSGGPGDAGIAVQVSSARVGPAGSSASGPAGRLSE